MVVTVAVAVLEKAVGVPVTGVPVEVGVGVPVTGVPVSVAVGVAVGVTALVWIARL